MTLLHILETLGALYLLELGFFAYAARRSRLTYSKLRTELPSQKVSVVVAAKDEEKNLPGCLQSLLDLEYPKELLEIIVVNDQSVDSTPEIIDSVAREGNLFVRRVDASEGGSTRGKANALAQGIDMATGEFIFLTDADCFVPPTWILETLKYFDRDTGIVGGVTLISNTARLIYGIQALDWDFLLTVGAGAASIGKPVACLGNNLAFRKKAYDEVGGYRKIRFSVTEDFALFKAVADSRKWKYKCIIKERQ
ncbi:MAG: glycosyltransferase [Thaumarchaeota archaeon]|nr:glycosyltransferase [Nitrososphaerota archaeon]